MHDFEDLKRYLSNVDMKKSKILSVGSGDGLFEKYLMDNNMVASIDCIDKKSINNSTIEADFVQYKFKKKYDFLFFIHSIHFIIGESYPLMDKAYFNFIKLKLYSLLKPRGRIFIKLVKKEWFIENKPTSAQFLSSLDNVYKNILKMKFKVLDITETKYDIYMMLQMPKA